MRMQSFEAECNMLRQGRPTSLDEKEKHELKLKLALLQEENQQLLCFKGYQDKLVSAKRFCALKPVGDEECLWIQFKHEKDYRVCAKCYKSGHSKSWCQDPAQTFSTQGNSKKVIFYVQSYKERAGNQNMQTSPKGSSLTRGCSSVLVFKRGTYNDSSMDCEVDEDSKTQQFTHLGQEDSIVSDENKNKMELLLEVESMHESSSEGKVLRTTEIGFDNEAGSENSGTTLAFISSTLEQEWPNIRKRYRRDTCVNRKKPHSVLQATKLLYKARRNIATYTININGKRKLGHKWGPRVFGSLHDLKRNKIEEPLAIMQQSPCLKTRS
ncbi:hypothetical protein PTKIN_Ptkin12aG0218200 [Pterospermum kingtungense]